MASEYMTSEEACEALGKSPDDLKALIAAGQLSEVRDGDKVYYKRTDIDQIAAKEGSSIVDLAAAEEVADEPGESESFASALSSLADSSSGLDLIDGDASSQAPEASAAAVEDAGGASPADLSVEDFPEELPAAPQEPEAVELEPAAASEEPMDLGLGSPIAVPAAEELDIGSPPEVPDLGLSGSSIISLEAAADELPAEAAPPAKKVGISVFDDDELEIESDPMGETHVTSSVEDFDAVGSGSGLLDLTRESDDTSLGAELLDVISPSEEVDTDTMDDQHIEAIDSADDQTVEDSDVPVAAVEEDAIGQEVAPVTVAARVAVAPMTGAVPINVTALLGILGLAFLGLATAAQIQGLWPAFMDKIASGTLHYAVFGGVALAAIVTGVLGILAGRGK